MRLEFLSGGEYFLGPMAVQWVEAHRSAVVQPVMRLAALALFVALDVAAARAQSPDSDAADGALPVPEPEGGFAVPDVPDSLLTIGNIEHPRFSLNLGLGMLLDYTWFDQDDASIAQVGVQEDTGEVRDSRLTARGEIRFIGPWRYQVTAQYKGFDREPTDTDDWTFTDVSMTRDFAFGSLSVGKLKQTFVYEMVGDAANLPQSERLLTPFFKSRDIGVRLMRPFRDGRASWAIGAYGQDGTQATARVTALPIFADDGRRYLHLALGLRYNGADDGQLRFSGRPESNVTDLFVDTGNIAADHAWHTGLEALWANGPYSLLAEVTRARVSSSAAGNPTFSGWYLTGTWTVTGGGPRPYDRKVSYARRMPVGHRFGEVELVARFGRVDLDDGLVSGGTLDKWFLGANWWATKRWKASLGYGDADLERFGRIGNTRMLLARLQWIH